jgi:hypothetical protein
VLVAGTPTAYPTPLAPPQFSAGWHFNLYNNLWGTKYDRGRGRKVTILTGGGSYIMWYPYVPEDANLVYRFVLSTH